MIRLALASCVVLAACGGDAPATTSVTRDSAGITIVENTGEPIWDAGEEWRVDSVPALRIGELEGDDPYLFQGISGLTRLSDGRIVIAGFETNDLRFFDGTGRHIRTVGRTGGGPGEFDGLSVLLRLPGDSLLAFDIRHSRVSLLAPTGDFVRSVRLDPVTDGLPRLVGVLGDGSLLVTTSPSFRPGSHPSGVVRDSTAFYRYSRQGTPIDTVARFPGAEFVVRSEAQRISISARAFGRSTSVVVRDTLLYVGTQDDWRIGVHSPDGRLLRVFRKRHVPAPVTREHIAAYREDRLAQAEEQWRRQVEEGLEAMIYPEFHPPYWGFMLDPHGNVWVRERGELAKPGRWTVLNPEGRLLGSITTPENFLVHEIGDDYLLGTSRDELDVARVRLHRLHR